MRADGERREPASLLAGTAAHCQRELLRALVGLVAVLLEEEADNRRADGADMRTNTGTAEQHDDDDVPAMGAEVTGRIRGTPTPRSRRGRERQARDGDVLRAGRCSELLA